MEIYPVITYLLSSYTVNPLQATKLPNFDPYSPMAETVITPSYVLSPSIGTLLLYWSNLVV